MPKPLLQGKIGYYVDGRLIHKPKRNSNEYEDYRVMPSQRYKRVKKREDKISKKVFETLTDLRNECKQGHAKAALFLLKKLMILDKFQIVRYIFYPDFEQRTPLYYAAHSGQHRVVEMLLSLYLINTTTYSSRDISLSQSFEDWFLMYSRKNMNGVKNFTLTDYNVCFLSALDDKTRYVLKEKKVTIHDCVAFLKSVVGHKNYAEFAINFKGNVSRVECMETKNTVVKPKRKNKKSKRPLLNFDEDDYMRVNQYGDDFFDHFSEQEDDYEEKDDNEKKTNEVVVSLSEDVKKAFLIANEEQPNGQRSILYDEEGNLSSSSHESLEWDVVSYENSVKSHDTNVSFLSYSPYKEALLGESQKHEEQLDTRKILNSWIILSTEDEVNKLETDKVKRMEENTYCTYSTYGSTNRWSYDFDDDVYNCDVDLWYYDADFVRNGYKCGRGGKKNRMFKGNYRSPKNDDTPLYKKSKVEMKKRNRRDLQKNLNRIKSY